MFRTGEQIVVTIWVGSLWTVGYLVAPTLFAVLDDGSVAGDIAGQLFRIEALLSIACAALLLVMHWIQPPRRFDGRVLLILGIVGLMSVNEWVLRPIMAATRDAAGDPTEHFALFHAVSAIIYLIASVLGLGLVVYRRPSA